MNRMRKLTIAAGALITALAVTTPAAHAETRDTVPPVTTVENTPGPIMDQWMDFTLDQVQVITPYPASAPLRCFVPYRSDPTECWQQRPDGRWQKLIPTFIPQVRGPVRLLPPMPSFVYPVWEDQAALPAMSSMSSL